MAFICFVCSDTVNMETSEEIREKYRDVIGINLSPESQLCYICCHILNKLSLFKSICLKRSLEYPILLSDKWPLNLQKSELKIHILCPTECSEDEQAYNNDIYQFDHSNDTNDETNCNGAQYTKLEHDTFNEYYQSIDNYVNGDEIIDNLNKQHHDDVDAEDTDRNNDFNKQYQYDDAIIDNIHDSDANVDIKVEISNTDYDESNRKDYNEIPYNDVNCDTIKATSDIDDTTVSSNAKKGKGSKSGKSKSEKGYKKIILSLDKQKTELEANRKKKKYLEAEFKCYNCALGFLFKDTYQAHMMRHEESNGEFQCETCTLRFATVASLRVHTACHSERYQCRKCVASLKPRAKRRHACFQPTEPQSVACHLCGNLLKDTNGLQQHLKRVHASKSGGRRYACGVCGEAYQRQGALRTHMIKHINRKFHCDQCPATYSSPYTLSQHKKSHGPTCGRTHYCDMCGAGYPTRKSLLAHLRNTSNHQTTTFECPICGRVCPTRKSLSSHTQSVHSATKEHACQLCPASYSSRKSLVRHAGAHRRKVEARVVVCHLCGTSFKGNSKLNRHIREVCGKTKDDQPSLYD